MHTILCIQNGHLRLDVVQLKKFANLYRKYIMHFFDYEKFLEILTG
ncbi:MAG: hypothetical protein HOP31_01265 [Ignavibacteria bacterium]|nr:hypothetical protein [Ignavibacteria bacterium]